MSFVYIGKTDHFKNHIKIGKTSNLLERKQQLNTSYPQYTFHFIFVICILEESRINNSQLEYILHDEYEQYKTNSNAGTEWFSVNDQKILTELRELLTTLEINGLKYKILSQEELNIELKRYSIKSTPKNTTLFDVLWNPAILLYDYQLECLEKSKELFLETPKLILNWTCGLGKTITSLRISSYFVSNRLLVGVPSILLLKQWLKQIETIRFYNRYKILIVCSSTKKERETIIGILNHSPKKRCLITTNKQKISTFIKSNNKYIVITLYQSSHILHELYTENNIKKEFEFSILDECHHLCKWLDNKTNRQNTDILQIPTKKQLGLTATMKKLKNKNSIDNYDVKLFGKILDSKSVLWAIENNKITDYQLLILNMTRQDLEDMMAELNINIDQCPNASELFLATYMTFRAFKCF